MQLNSQDAPVNHSVFSRVALCIFEMVLPLVAQGVTRCLASLDNCVRGRFLTKNVTGSFQKTI